MSTIAAILKYADNSDEFVRNQSRVLDSVEITGKSIDKLAKQFSDSTIVSNAAKWAAAIEKVGGVSRLNAADQEKANAVIQKAIDSYQRMGEVAPQSLRDLQTALAGVNKELDPLASGMNAAGKAASDSSKMIAGMGEAGRQAAAGTKAQSEAWGSFVQGFDPKTAISDPLGTATTAVKGFVSELGPIGAVAIGVMTGLAAVGTVALKLAESAAAVGGNLNDMGERTGIVVPKLSRLSQAAQVAGTDVNTLSGTIQKMDAAAADSPEKFAKGLEKIGLNFQDFIALAPEDRLMAVSSALAATSDSAVRNAAGMELMGKQFREIEPALMKLNEGMAITAGISVWTDQQAKDAEQFEMQMKALNLEMSDFGVRIGRDLIPPALAFLAFLKDARSFVSDANKWTPWGIVWHALGTEAAYVSAGFDLVRGSLNRLPDALGDATKKAQELKERLYDASHTPAIELAKLLAPIKGLTHDAGDLDLAWRSEERSNADAVETLKKSVAEAEAWRKVIENVNSAGDGWKGTLNAIDGSLITWAKHLLEAGVSAQDVAKYYGLTDTQVKALQKSLEQDKAFLVLQENIKKIEFGVNGLGDAVEKLGTKSNDPAFAAAFERNYEAAKHVEDGVFGISKGLENIGTKVDAGTRHLTTMSDVVGMLAGSFTLLGRNSDNAFGSMIGEIGQVLTLLGRTDQQIKQLGAGKDGKPLTSGNWGMGGVMFDDEATRGQKAQAAAAVGISVAEGARGVWDATSSHASTAGNAGAGALAGAKAGAAFGPYGMAIGAAAGLIIGIIRGKPEWAKAAEDVGRDFGVKISDALAKEIESVEQSAHTSRLGAELLSLNKIIAEAGGLSGKNIGQMTARLHDVFSMIETHQLTIAQGTQIIDENWQAFAAAGTDADGRLSASLKEIVALNQRFGTQSKEIAAYLQQQGQAAAQGFNAIVVGLTSESDSWQKLHDDIEAANTAWDKAKAAGDSAGMKKANDDFVALYYQRAAIAEQDKQSLADLGVQAVATYAAMVASGKSAAEALQAVSPSLTTLQKAYENLGLNVDDVALKNLLMQNTITQGNPALMSAIGGLNQEMIALDNMGLMNADTFGAMERTGMQMYTRLQAQVAAVGGSTKDALIPMQGYLQQAAKQADLLGIPLDDNTASLIAQSKELGIWKDVGKSATEANTDAMKSLVDVVKDLVNQLRGIPTRIDTTVVTHHEDDYPAPDYVPPGASTGGLVTASGIQHFFGMGGMVGSLVPQGTDTVPAMLTPGEVVLNSAQQHNVADQLLTAAAGPVVDMSEFRRLREELTASNARAERLLRGLPNDMARSMRDAKILAG